MIDHINRYVSDVERHVAFYRDVLGYRLLDRGKKNDESDYAILQGDNHELFISEKSNCAPGNSLRHIGYCVEDVDEILRKLKKMGLAGEDAAIIVKQYSRQLYIRDPDGLEIDLIQWTDKKGFYEDAAARNRERD
ncbi:MAG: VOC family protein [Spirochaetes bacterium]|nr:VOC family protein [Spirochaetota bacterium]